MSWPWNGWRWHPTQSSGSWQWRRSNSRHPTPWPWPDQGCAMRAPRQLLLAEMQAAQAALTRTHEPSDAAIHAARQHVKRARAILRLLRTAVGPRVYRQLNRELRDCNRALRAARDRSVVMETLRALGVRKPYLKPAISGVEAYWREHRGDGH